MPSKKPKKQRKARYGAPLHKRQKLVAARLSKSLTKQLGRRSLPVRKGDEVRIARGKYKGTVGKVSKVDLKELKVYLENLKRKKVSGAEVFIPLEPSNLIITNVVMEDRMRKKIIERKKVKSEKKG